MTSRKKKTDCHNGITRKEFLKRMSWGALGLLGFRYAPAFGLNASTATSLDTAAISNAPEYMIIHARVIKGNGDIPELPCSIHIRDGLIVAIDANLPVSGLPVLDVMGATVMPGLIDSHVHLTSVPGYQFREDSDETAWAYRFNHLKSYLAAGVTTVLDTGISASALEEIQAYLHAGGIGPGVYALGPSFVKQDGYIDVEGFYPDKDRYLMCPPAVTRQDVLDLFDRFQDIPNIIGAKMFIEQGFATAMDAWEIHDETMRGIIREEAAKRNLPLWIHAMSREEQNIALEINPRVIAHVGFMDEYLDRVHLNALFNAGVYINSTQVIPHLPLSDVNLAWCSTDLARLIVPPAELHTAMDPDAWIQYHAQMFDLVVPDTTPGSALMEDLLNNNPEVPYPRYAERTGEALLKMHTKGIPIAMGSDSGGLPFSLNYFHGLTSIIEMECMAGAGMPPDAVLESSTRIPAEMMGLSDKIGTLAPGKCADLIVLEDDPLTGISAYQSLLLTIKDGVAKTPSEWMEG